MKNLVAAVLLTASLGVVAQDIDRHKFVVQHVKLPLSQLPPHIESYRTDVQPHTSELGTKLGNDYHADRLVLNGYHRLDNSDRDAGDLVIRVAVKRDLVFEQVKAYQSELTYKANKESPTIKYFPFSYAVYYRTAQIQAQLIDRSGTVLGEITVGGKQTKGTFGPTSYDNHYRTEGALSRAWADQRQNYLSSAEKNEYDGDLQAIAGWVGGYCMHVVNSEDFSVRYIDEKKTNNYQDYREARDHFLTGVSLVATDRIEKVNKLVQPDYENRKASFQKAIDLWEKAMEEVDYENKKARIDKKVARHTYYNLALAYAWMDNYDKAKEYLQGRKEDVGGWDRNFLAGIQALKTFIEDQEKRHEANGWRKTLLALEQPFVYRTPAEKAALASASGNTKSKTAAKTKAKPKTAAKPTAKKLQTAANTKPAAAAGK